MTAALIVSRDVRISLDSLTAKNTLVDIVVSRRSTGLMLLAFFADRLKVQLREQGARHDLVDAVFALDGSGRPA